MPNMTKRTFDRMRQYGIAIFIGAVALPLLALAARTAAPTLTGLFATTQVAVALPSPVISLGLSTTSGSVYSNGGAALYFEVTALDGIGESLGSQLLGTTTVNEAHGWNITWSKIQGAVSYRVYFSTSTPLAMTQYFLGTSTSGLPNSYYTFTSTSSPVFIPAGITQTNTAYVDYLSGVSGNSYINAGNFAVGTSTPVANFTAQATSTNATTTIEEGKSGQNKGSCLKKYRTDGSAIYEFIAAGATSYTLTTTPCATVTGF
jgi:hypothetical protein